MTSAIRSRNIGNTKYCVFIVTYFYFSSTARTKGANNISITYDLNHC